MKMPTLKRTRRIRPPASPWLLNGQGGLAVVCLSLLLACPAGAQSPFAISEEDSRVRGHREAPLTLLEYSDFTCGYCVKFFQETWPMLFSQYVETGKLRLVYRDFPRAETGPSVDTAQAARCAGEQGQYWAMHDRLFSSQNKFSSAQLRQQADTLQLDVPRFTTCLEEARDTKDIFADRDQAYNFGFRGTPGFVLYMTKNPQNGVSIPGAFPYKAFQEEIENLLNEEAPPQPSPELMSGFSASERLLPAGASDALTISDEDSRVRGHRQAPLTLLEYSDFTCGYCGKFFRETWPMLFSQYVQTGKLRLVYRDFPRAPDGPSVDAAQAARCAGEQGEYWAMHDRLFTSRNKFSPAQLRQQADTLQLDVPRFTACLEEAHDTKDIFADRDQAHSLGFRGTPGFVLYMTATPRKGVPIPGALPYNIFQEEIENLLNAAATPQPSPELASGSSASE